MNESVTVVIACYNHVEYLEEALDSVKSQTMLPAQLIVTDDASSDGSADLIAGWLADNWPDAVFIRNQNNQGFPATLNLAIPHVTGTFLAIMSADDQMCEDRLELQARALMAWPEAGMVYSDMLEVRPDGELTGQRWFDSDRQGPALPPTSQPGSPVDLYLPMLERAFISAPTVLMRTAALREAGCYDEHLIAEDYDMFLRLSRSWYWVYLPEPLVIYRVLPTSLARSEGFRANLRAGRIHLLRKHLGSDRSGDRIIARRVGRMASGLYQEGERGPKDSWRDLLLAFRLCPSLRIGILLCGSLLRVPGPWLVRH